MTERPSELKRVSSNAATDPTATETERMYPQEREPPASDPDPLAFDPGKFSRIEFSYEERQRMLQVKLPRLAPECFLDTIPPQTPLAAPAPSAAPEPPSTIAEPHSAEAESISVVAKRRRPVGVIVVCLLGALLLLVLAMVRSWNHEPKPMASTTSAPVVVSAAPELAVPSPPATSTDPPEHAAPGKAIPDLSDHAPTQIPVSKGTAEHKSSKRPSSERSNASQPAQASDLPEIPAIPTVSTAPIAPALSAAPNSPPSPSPSPVQSNWFDYK